MRFRRALLRADHQGQPRSSHDDIVQGVCYSPGEEGTLASCGDDDCVRIWDAGIGRVRSENFWDVWETRGFIAAPARGKFNTLAREEATHGWGAAQRGILAVTFAPGRGDTLFLAAGDGHVYRWDTRSPPGTTSMMGGTGARHAGASLCLAHSPDGQVVATGGTGGSVVFVDVVANREIGRARPHQSDVFSLAWSPDGGLLLSASADCSVQALAYPLQPPGGAAPLWRAADWCYAVAFDQESGCCAAACRDGAVRTWSAPAALREYADDHSRHLADPGGEPAPEAPAPGAALGEVSETRGVAARALAFVASGGAGEGGLAAATLDCLGRRDAQEQNEVLLWGRGGARGWALRERVRPAAGVSAADAAATGAGRGGMSCIAASASGAQLAVACGTHVLLCPRVEVARAGAPARAGGTAVLVPAAPARPRPGTAAGAGAGRASDTCALATDAALVTAAVAATGFHGTVADMPGGAQRGAPVGAAAAVVAPWACGTCTLRNLGIDACCSCCGTARAVPGLPAAAAVAVAAVAVALPPPLPLKSGTEPAEDEVADVIAQLTEMGWSGPQLHSHARRSLLPHRCGAGSEGRTARAVMWYLNDGQGALEREDAAGSVDGVGHSGAGAAAAPPPPPLTGDDAAADDASMAAQLQAKLEAEDAERLKFECPICYETLPAGHTDIVDLTINCEPAACGCRHTACRVCTSRFLTGKIAAGSVSDRDLLCMLGCGAASRGCFTASVDMVSEVLQDQCAGDGQRWADKFNLFRIRQGLPGFVRCPVQDCDSGGVVEGAYCTACKKLFPRITLEASRSRCDACGSADGLRFAGHAVVCTAQHRFCPNCLSQPPHEGATCEQHAERREREAASSEADRSFKQWGVAEGGGTTCPACKFVSYGHMDCDHVHCSQPACRLSEAKDGEHGGFCVACLAERKPIYYHGNHYHARACRYFTVCCQQECTTAKGQAHCKDDVQKPQCTACVAAAALCAPPRPAAGEGGGGAAREPG